MVDILAPFPVVADVSDTRSICPQSLATAFGNGLLNFGSIGCVPGV